MLHQPRSLKTLGLHWKIVLVAVLPAIVLAACQLNRPSTPFPTVITVLPPTSSPTARPTDALAPQSTASPRSTLTSQPAIPPTTAPAPTAVPTVALLPLPAGSTQVAPVDGMVQVYIPAGEFTMGEDEFIYRAGARPAHLVSLDAYWIDQTEVTHGMYDLCVQAGACQWRSSYTYTLADALIPVGYVNWNESLAYCTWAGRRLPTEAEWEKAARGTDGRIYPWGNTAPNCYLANSYSCAGQVMPAGSYPDGKSPYGVLEMAGNLWEWVADWYQEDYYSVSPAYNPAGPASGIYRVVRGGGWFGVKEGLRTTYRLYNTPGYGTVEYGFRCAATVAP